MFNFYFGLSTELISHGKEVKHPNLEDSMIAHSFKSYLTSIHKIYYMKTCIEKLI